ncbi:hypothetical protein AB0D14_35960 [Streptomyces sp. NPDC048484]|uniref:hypothetical protein n=1 Tax=Streptomyces sp. NPDC048484 TaxID=3155146 RepID=UPI00343FBCD5
MIELDGLLHQVPAEYHATGALAEHMVTARAFYADSLFGECPVPVAIPLYRPTAGTHPALSVVDDLAEFWVMEFDVWHNQVRYHITGFYPAQLGSRSLSQKAKRLSSLSNASIGWRVKSAVRRGQTGKTAERLANAVEVMPT